MLGKDFCEVGSGCDSVGRAVAFDTRGLRLESSHWGIFDRIFVYLLSTVLKRRNKENEVGTGPFEKIFC